MSYWKAYAQASDVSDADLRAELIAAYETIHKLASALEAKPTEAGLLDAIDDLQRDVEYAKEEARSAQANAADAEERLEAKLQEPGREKPHRAR